MEITTKMHRKICKYAFICCKWEIKHILNSMEKNSKVSEIM